MFLLEMDYSNTVPIRGICYSMCPEGEIKLRESERLLHPLEVMQGTENDKIPKADINKVVKCYCRPAADTHLNKAEILRPFPVLYHALTYLLLEVTGTTKVSSVDLYNFISDRLRAVRQDMTIQALPPEECVQLLEPMIRFYVLFGYKLCELTAHHFDPVLHKKQLLECLKLALLCFDEIEKRKHLIQESVMESEMKSLSIKENSSRRLSCDRILLEKLYILCNLDDSNPLSRYHHLPQEIRKGVSFAYQLAVYNQFGNYVKVCRIIRKSCPLSICAFVVYLPKLQRKAFLIMSHAYNSKQLTVPIDTVRDWLLFNSSKEACDVAKSYGLNCTSGCIKFEKSNFKGDVAQLMPRKFLPMEAKINQVQIYTYTT